MRSVIWAGQHEREKDDDALRSIVTSRRDRIILHILIVVLAIVFAVPLLAVIVDSLKINGLGNYVDLFVDPIGSVPIWKTYVNSLVIGAIHAVVVVGVSSMAGFAFSKLHFWGRELAFAAVVLFLAVPGIALVVPVYRISLELDLFNNYFGVALPEAALTIPFGVLMMRNQGMSVSPSLVEAAQLDGASQFQVFRNVFLPLVRPAIVNLTILCFVWSLQDFLWPSFLFTDPQMASAAQAVQTFSNALGQGVADLAKYHASLVLLALPAVLFVVVGLKFIVNGLASGATKE
ncbi:carbohydrate ABC transporter permease [Schaalia naturae]|uniref:Carbohydrate ABC transporter permease n=1 Tax=Schaalia naturae TaxID=635203 RepID=A0ABW2SNY1_9ACTO